MLGVVGMAVLSTDRMENWVGSMVAGSMARFMRVSAMATLLWGSWTAEARAKVARESLSVDFIVGVLVLGGV